jgi:hypothetical protein
MRASIPATILFAALASCSSETSYSDDQDQEAALASIMSKLNALTSNSAYTPFQTVAESVAVEFYKTQTVVASINPTPTDTAEASANLELSFAYMSEVENFAETQTIISGTLKATVTAALNDYMSVMSDIQIPSSALSTETGKVTGSAFSTGKIHLSSTKTSKSTTMETVTSKASTALETTKSKATSASSAATSSLSEEPSATKSGAASASSEPASGALGRTVSRMFAGAIAGVVMAVVLL